MYTSTKVLVEEGWLSDAWLVAEELNQKVIDELVFDIWSWGMKLNIEKLKNNKFLQKRVENTNFKKVIIEKRKRLDGLE